MKLFGKNVELRKFALEAAVIPAMAVTTLTGSLVTYRTMVGLNYFTPNYERAIEDREELLNQAEAINEAAIRRQYYLDLLRTMEHGADNSDEEAIRSIIRYESKQIKELEVSFVPKVFTNTSLSEQSLYSIVNVASSNDRRAMSFQDQGDYIILSLRHVAYIRDCQRQGGFHRGEPIEVTFNNAYHINRCTFSSANTTAVREYREMRANIASTAIFGLGAAFSMVASIALVSRKKKKPTQKATSKTQPPPPKP